MLDKEILEAIEENARLAFSNRQIAIIVQIPWISFQAMAEDETDPVSLALSRGRLLAEAEVRESVFNMARSGSPQAQQMAQAYFHQMKIDNLDE